MVRFAPPTYEEARSDFKGRLKHHKLYECTSFSTDLSKSFNQPPSWLTTTARKGVNYNTTTNPNHPP